MANSTGRLNEFDMMETHGGQLTIELKTTRISPYPSIFNIRSIITYILSQIKAPASLESQF